MPASSSTRGATVVVQREGKAALEHQSFQLAEAGGETWTFEETRVRIGAGPGNDLLLEDPTVSSVHCELHLTERGVRVRDLGSTNGTFVEGVRITEAFLDDGHALRVGERELRFSLGKGVIREELSDDDEFFGAVGGSSAMRAVFSRAAKVARANATVLISGETGTGKEVLAQAIYDASPRRDAPFVVVDCGAIAKNLVESELFGHEKGAFTGAHARRIGAFERASGGTLFLDELGELELELQPKLLRALERREIQRLGGESVQKVDVRIIAATNRDLRAMVARGEFREDLYYRLAVVTLDLPPLRERREDIPQLCDLFLKQIGATRDELPPGAVDRFVEHAWPGNCRELKNAVERAVVLGETQPLGSVARRGSREGGAVVDADGPTGQFTVVPDLPYKQQKADVIADFEERYARLLLKEHDGNVSAAARQAGIDRMSLHKILARYDLDPRALAKGS